MMTLEYNYNAETAARMQRDFERKEHERRVWEMFNSVVKGICAAKATVTKADMVTLAENLTAEYEQRMKEQREAKDGTD